MKITKSNIGLVKFRLSKLAKTQLSTQYSYTSNKKINSILKNCGITEELYTAYNYDAVLLEVEKSCLCTIQNVHIEQDISLYDDLPYLRIHNNSNSHFNFRAFLLRIGDEIEFYNNLIKVRTKHPINKSKCILHRTQFN